MQVPELIIDPSLKYWALFPITFAMILFGLLRQNINLLLTPTPKKKALSKRREAEQLEKAQLFKRNYWNLPLSDFKAKQEWLILRLTDGTFIAEKPKQENELPQNPLTDPNASEGLMNMAKNSFGNMIAQYAMMGWINFFFTGFILMKLPFPLTYKFKQMLQAGIATTDLDVRWVSAISWYFISTLGLSSVFNVLYGDTTIASTLNQQQQPSAPAVVSPQANRAMEAEANDLKIISHKYVLDDVESRILHQYNLITK
ncbi:hypothetical protein WICMUC_001475 [Wickerhamomyces mucosus]|uniref:ER membrane protein complex subunit 3 n=1 Tax=Wickerhamomyces mucosus TaxID=1378264 RepID=A0A9P8PU89_9ASCO|nr:hypothetical protein WICMUC_001475 [Wickerhamomyces mucosus]